jgi:hypothetical protein
MARGSVTRWMRPARCNVSMKRLGKEAGKWPTGGGVWHRESGAPRDVAGLWLVDGGGRQAREVGDGGGRALHDGEACRSPVLKDM